MLITNYSDAKKIWNEITSGVVFRDRLKWYESFENYRKTKRYLEYEVHEYGEFDEDAVQIIKDIKAGCNTTKDVFGRTLQIWSIKDLEEMKEDFYLLKNKDSLFEITTRQDNVKGKYEKHIRITDNVALYYKEDSEKPWYNLALCVGLEIIAISGDAIFTGYTTSGELTKIDTDSLLYILQYIRWNIGDSGCSLRLY